MRIFFFIFLILVLNNCTTIEVAKEVSKATTSIKTSVDNMIKTLEKDKEVLEIEKKNEKKLVVEQKKISRINFLEKKLEDIESKIGKPAFKRIDGDTQITRFDATNCRLFLFTDSVKKKSTINYFEIRDANGNLVIKKKEVEKCYAHFKLT